MQTPTRRFLLVLDDQNFEVLEFGQHKTAKKLTPIILSHTKLLITCPNTRGKKKKKRKVAQKEKPTSIYIYIHTYYNF